MSETALKIKMKRLEAIKSKLDDIQTYEPNAREAEHVFVDIGGEARACLVGLSNGVIIYIGRFRYTSWTLGLSIAG